MQNMNLCASNNIRKIWFYIIYKNELIKSSFYSFKKYFLPLNNSFWPKSYSLCLCIKKMYEGYTDIIAFQTVIFYQSNKVMMTSIQKIAFKEYFIQ